jgi:hypothetical protein
MREKIYMRIIKVEEPFEISMNLDKYYEKDNNLIFKDKSYFYEKADFTYSLESFKKLNSLLYLTNYRIIPENRLYETFYNIILKEVCFRFKSLGDANIDEILFLEKEILDKIYE